MQHPHLQSLPGYAAKAVEKNDDGLTFDCISTTAPTTCPHCQSTRFSQWGSRQRQVVDAPYEGKRVILAIEQLRYRCKDCSRTFMQPLEHIGEKKYTARLSEMLIAAAMRASFTEVATQLQIPETTVAQVFHQHVERLDQGFLPERYARASMLAISWARMVGIKTGKGRGARTMLVANAGDGTLIDIIDLPVEDEHRPAAELREKLKRSKSQPPTWVSMPPWPWARDAVRAAAPGCAISIERDFVMSLAMECCHDFVRASRNAEASNRHRGAAGELTLMATPLQQLTAEQKKALQRLQDRFPQHRHAHGALQGLQALYEASTAARAQEALQSATELTAAMPAFHPLHSVLVDWRDEILAHANAPAQVRSTIEQIARLRDELPALSRGNSYLAARASVLYGTSEGPEHAPRLDQLAKRLSAGKL